MYTFQCDLVGIEAMSQSKPVGTPKLPGETDEDHDERTWREHQHITEAGVVFIPPMAIKLCLDGCARYLSEKIPGRRNNTYTKHFEAGLMVDGPVTLRDPNDQPILGANIEAERLFLNSDGKKGGGSRVWRRYPRIPSGWRGTVTIHVFDETVTPEKLEEYLVHAGKFIGLGRFRPRNGGYYGRFVVENVKVEGWKRTPKGTEEAGPETAAA